MSKCTITTLELPTVFHSNNAGMDIFAGFAPDNYNKVRGRTLLTKEQTSRDSSMSSTKSSIAYHERMECNNAMNVDIVVATTCHSRTNDLTASKALSRAIK